MGGDGARVMVLEVAQGTRPADLLDQSRSLNRKHRLTLRRFDAEAENSFADFGITPRAFRSATRSAITRSACRMTG